MSKISGVLFFASITIFGLLLKFTATAQESTTDSVSKEFCVSLEEVKLYNLINEYRKAMSLNELSLSKSLSHVAKSHCIDLITNKPDTSICNFHSWSDKGSWKACCFEKKIKDRSCMLNKPQELTDYPGFGYEIIYWENKEATADKAFDQWRETLASRALLTNFKDWESYHWQSIGLAIHQGFAIAWFGEEADPVKEVTICETGKVIKQIENKKPSEIPVLSSETARFYLIVGSFTTLEEAKEQAKKYFDEGFKKVKIISKEDKFRISLSDYPTMDDATAAKNELPQKFDGAWVLTF